MFTNFVNTLGACILRPLPRTLKMAMDCCSALKCDMWRRFLDFTEHFTREKLWISNSGLSTQSTVYRAKLGNSPLHSVVFQRNYFAVAAHLPDVLNDGGASKQRPPHTSPWATYLSHLSLVAGCGARTYQRFKQENATSSLVNHLSCCTVNHGLFQPVDSPRL